MDCVPFSWIRRPHNVKGTFFPQTDLGIITIPIEKKTTVLCVARPVDSKMSLKCRGHGSFSWHLEQLMGL